MNLDDAQRKKVSEWIAQGLKLSEIQSRLGSEFGLRVTYMDVRFLVDDLKLTPKDAEPATVSASSLTAPAAAASPGKKGSPVPPPAAATAPPSNTADLPGGVSVKVDQLARPGAVVSGKVTFNDGNTAEWYFDQMGRLGLVPQQPGYRPPPADLQQFQAALDGELSKLGF